jgi:DNA phosphorothioation-associated putative methyltransferase
MAQNIPGKVVQSSHYFHIEAIRLLSTAEKDAIDHAERLAQLNRRIDYNVVRLSVDLTSVSFLRYPRFFDAPFPELEASWRIELNGPHQVRNRNYAESLNPPILHRKELLLPDNHQAIDRFKALTNSAEALGLFDDPSRIGFRNQWERLIADKGYRLIDHEFVPLGNDISEGDQVNDFISTDEVRRHLTALVRYGFSAPVQMLARFGFLDGSRSIFDYGCGRGDDLRGLQENGIQVQGWDPHYAPDNPKLPAHIVNLGFVINVIEDINERIEALQGAYSLAKELLVVSVMLATQYATGGKPFRDGVMTSRGTFQKYFTPNELKIFIEQHLHEESIPVSPGVFFIFKDKDAEQRFMISRSRSRSNLLRAASQAQRAYKPNKAERDLALYAEHRELLDALWQQWLEAGREPDKSEVANLPQVLEVFGSLPKALRFLKSQKDEVILDATHQLKKEDLLVYFALSKFEKRKPYRHLECHLQRDIKAFFVDYGSAQLAARELLFKISQPELLEAACREAASAGLGWHIEGESLQLHSSLVERLPPILRVYVGCGATLYGDITSADLVKIHIQSGKLTLMRFDEFLGNPIPKMIHRVKILFRRLEFQLFEYGDEYESPNLYLKSRYMNEETDGYSDQFNFDTRLESLNLFDLSGYGPSPSEFAHKLQLARWEIDGMRLIRSRSIPNLDDPCGNNFTYRDFIECGETQARTGLPNLPKMPDTYTAFYELASKILDPVIDYFGMIKLTYGFCTTELAKEIPGRIAPELDQHASHEKKRNGKFICERLGAACDFIVEDQDMGEVVTWVFENTPVDRIYIYEKNRPIHVSWATAPIRQITKMELSPSGKRVPRTSQN